MTGPIHLASPTLHAPSEHGLLARHHLGKEGSGPLAPNQTTGIREGVESHASSARGGLSLSQTRRARRFIEANLDRDLCVADLAIECRLSPGHFSRAFKVTFGEPPHRYLLVRRIETAKRLLRGTRIALAAVAAQCGFADQSHMTRVFARAVGATPGQWRRYHS